MDANYVPCGEKRCLVLLFKHFVCRFSVASMLRHKKRVEILTFCVKFLKVFLWKSMNNNHSNIQVPTQPLNHPSTPTTHCHTVFFTFSEFSESSDHYPQNLSYFQKTVHSQNRGIQWVADSDEVLPPNWVVIKTQDKIALESKRFCCIIPTAVRAEIPAKNYSMQLKQENFYQFNLPDPTRPEWLLNAPDKFMQNFLLQGVIFRNFAINENPWSMRFNWHWHCFYRKSCRNAEIFEFENFLRLLTSLALIRILRSFDSMPQRIADVIEANVVTPTDLASSEFSIK